MKYRPGQERLGPRYWRLWSATSISGVGSGMTLAAIPLLSVVYSSDPRVVSLVTAAAFLPALMFGLHSGAIVDRGDRRRLMLAADGVRLLAVALFAVLVMGGRGNIQWLLAVAFILGSAEILFENAASAFVPMLVSRSGLGSANSKLLATQTISMQFIGIPLGGTLFVVGASAPFVVDAMTYAVALALILVIKGSYATSASNPVGHPITTAAPRRTVWQDVREGAAWLWRHKPLRGLAMLTAVLNLAFATGESTLVLYASRVLGLDERGYAFLLSLLAVGAIAGSLVAARVRVRFGTVRTLGAAGAAMGAGFVVPATTSSLPATIAALIAGGAASMVWNIVTVTARQELVPDVLLGRVTSAYRVVALGVLPLGALFGGVVASEYGLHAPWVAASALMVGASIVAAMPDGPRELDRRLAVAG